MDVGVNLYAEDRLPGAPPERSAAINASLEQGPASEGGIQHTIVRPSYNPLRQYSRQFGRRVVGSEALPVIDHRCQAGFMMACTCFPYFRSISS